MKYKVGDIVKLSTGEKGTITKAWGRYSATIGDDNYDEYNFDEKEIIGLWEGYKPKLKLIDILNKIANGELKEGAKVKWGKDEYTYYGDDEFYRYRGKFEVSLWEDMYIGSLNEEVELIEPQEPTECEHEWAEYTGYNAKTGETKHYRECVECGLQEEIEDNTTEKIEELIDWYQLIDGTTDEEKIHIVWNKLNEVIKHINLTNDK